MYLMLDTVAQRLTPTRIAPRKTSATAAERSEIPHDTQAAATLPRID
ncbi:MAG: hypothetical protein ABSF67_22960 [Roseiarcus sp.]|jgi:hypothetical protein